MISNEQYVALSLELDLFFLRIAKEHAIFLEAGFPSKYGALIRQAEMHKLTAARLLQETIDLANGNISSEALNSGEFITPLTMDAERKTQQLTGIMIDSNLTRMQQQIRPGIPRVTPELLQRVGSLNQRAHSAASMLVRYIDRVYAEDTTCKIFNYLYPHNIEHVGREIRQYMNVLARVQRRDDLTAIINAVEELIFWNRIMEDHAEFIRGLLDPTEKQLFNRANQFSRQFEQLVNESNALTENPSALPAVIARSISETSQIIDFKRQGEIGILGCKIKSLINPLLADHVLREANHYLRMLRIIQGGSLIS